MKRTIRGIFSLAIALVMLLSLGAPVHAATYDYAVEGGNLKFDPATGIIKDCQTSVYSANIPSEIYGVTVKEIGDSAFRDCNKLSSVTIPKTVTRIGGQAFRGCSQLTSVTIPDSVTSLGTGPYPIFYSCKKLETATIPGSIKHVSRLFSECESLKTVTFGYGVEEIDHVFFSCKALEEVTLPDSVKNISQGSFSSCTALKTVTLGSGLNHIDSGAFSGCSSLSALYFRGSAPAATDRMISKFADGFMIYYPEGASGWTTPTWNGYITKPYTPSGSVAQPAPAAPATPAPSVTPPVSQPASNLVTAVPAFSPVYVNGVQVQFDAYNIDKNNYFKLRDLAFILSGTKAQFNVEWKNAITMTSGQPYTPVGGEMAAGSGINQIAKPTSSAVLLDGNSLNLTAYNINGNNYFKLRDIGKLFDFDVHWDSALQGVVIQPDAPYTDV